MASERHAGVTVRIAIIGAGFSGIGLGIRLRRAERAARGTATSTAGWESFTIFDKADGVGGTWRDNTYPGAACDTPSMHYCFSFARKVDWSRKWAPQPEILDYLERCVDEHGLRSHLRLQTEIESARFDEERGVWVLRTKGGGTHEAEVLVSGVGQLGRPYVPDIPGLGDFEGPCFHSARWDHDVELRGKRVAVIGNAASAVQLVPPVAERARELLVFQRSANWMLRQNNRRYTELEKTLFRRVPGVARLVRWGIWLQHELRFPVFRQRPLMSRWARQQAFDYLQEDVREPWLREALVPDYPIGGKRVLLSDEYYRTLERDDVRVITTGIERVERDAVHTKDGERHPVDVIVLATGFRASELLAPMRIEGRGGRSLNDAWRDGAEAYLGMTVSGFPNLFIMYGPNTNLGHNSILFMIE
ncbi:MAG: flavin-containing monooxygenase, partial [Polyangiales bacterium]